MTCQPSAVPPIESIDVEAVRARYRQERDLRMRRDGQAQYVQLSGGVLPDYAEDPFTPPPARAPVNEDLDVVILGAGWGGILAAHHLKQQGVGDLRNIDTAGDFGGVWYWNQYPGVQCDNDAYCYLPLLEETGFLPSKKFADGAEIQAYARSIAERDGFADRALLGTQITSIHWNEDAARWEIATNRGDHLRARFMVVAPGVLNMPKLPRIAGIESFGGKIFHTSRWDYDYTGGSWGNPVLDRLADKAVAIVGTGATAIQAVPHLARHARQLFVVQRTPSTVDERPNPPTDPAWAAGLKPGWQQQRMANFHRGAQEMFQPGEADQVCDIWTEINRNLIAELSAEGREIGLEEFLERREAMDFRVMERLRARCEALVRDPATAEALKPWYHHLCKRPLSSDDYYPCFNQPHVTLLDVSQEQGIARITETGFVANGRDHAVDCIIFASGFEVTSDLDRRWGIGRFEGRGGVSIYDHWRDGPRTLHGIATHDFPNQFFIGYIQGGVNSSVTEQFGRQGAHAAWIIAEALKRGLRTVEPTAEAVDGYVRLFQEIKPDISALQARCPPGYFNNEGETNPRWALFPGWGRGWDDFEAMLAAWRAAGDLEGMQVTR